jgi:hypothetical protein
MGVFSITTAALINLPPDRLGVLELDFTANQTHVFTLANFTTETTPTYNDPEDDAVESIKITQLEVAGSLELDGTPVTLNQIIPVAEIGDLVYTPTDTSGASVDVIKFDLSDVGSSTFSGLTTGVINLTMNAVTNLPPSAVGDNEIDLAYGISNTFTRAQFTSGTTPPYSDPEGDFAFLLKVLSLPLDGDLKLDGVLCTINQEILFADIDSGLLVWSPNLELTGLQDFEFRFAIADKIDGIFVE